MDLARLDLYAADHHGLITRRAAERAGVSKATWYRWLDVGRLILVFPGVARLVGSPETPLQRVAAAVLAAQPDAMASHRSAARVWGEPRPDDDPIDLISVSRTRGLALDGVIIHRPRDDKDLTPVRRHNILVCNVLRYPCDIEQVEPGGARQSVLHIVTHGLASPVALRNACNVHTRRGRHGIPAFRDALDEFVIDGKPVDSVLESTMRDVAVRFSLPAMEFHAIVCGLEVDFLVTGTPIVLECDGWDTHGRRRATFERDRERDAFLIENGFIVVRFTHRRLTRDPKWVVNRVRGALARWGHLVPPAWSGRPRSRFRD